METPVLWAFEEDIQTRSWTDWLMAHTSLLKPLHRYEGVLSVLPDRIRLAGHDKRTGNAISFDIFKFEMEELYLGFDETFNITETRNLGLTWSPLRISFMKEGRLNRLYLITNYQFVRTDNPDYFQFLKEWLS